MIVVLLVCSYITTFLVESIFPRQGHCECTFLLLFLLVYVKITNSAVFIYLPCRQSSVPHMPSIKAVLFKTPLTSKFFKFSHHFISIALNFKRLWVRFCAHCCSPPPPPPPTSHPNIILSVPVFDIDTCNVGWEVLCLTN